MTKEIWSATASRLLKVVIRPTPSWIRSAGGDSHCWMRMRFCTVTSMIRIRALHPYAGTALLHMVHAFIHDDIQSFQAVFICITLYTIYTEVYYIKLAINYCKHNNQTTLNLLLLTQNVYCAVMDYLIMFLISLCLCTRAAEAYFYACRI